MTESERIIDFDKLIEKPKSDTIFDLAHISRDAFSPLDLGRSSGFQSLDFILGGIRKKEITVISANTGLGKTTFALNILMHISRQGYPIWINSYEMHQFTIFRKIASQLLGRTLKTSPLTEDEIIEFYTYILKFNIYINNTGLYHDIYKLRKDIDIISNAYEVRYILLDHLDYITYSDNKLSSLERLDYVMKELHSLALEYDVGIILIAHPTKLPANKTKYSMNELRGSSSISQYADNVIILNRAEHGLTEFSVQKNRLLGVTRNFKLAFDTNTDSYTEPEAQHLPWQ